MISFTLEVSPSGYCVKKEVGWEVGESWSSVDGR